MALKFKPGDGVYVTRDVTGFTHNALGFVSQVHPESLYPYGVTLIATGTYARCAAVDVSDNAPHLAPAGRSQCSDA